MAELILFFFFQAEVGLRVFHVTGVQTCALPISSERHVEARERIPVPCQPLRARDAALGGGEVAEARVPEREEIVQERRAERIALRLDDREVLLEDRRPLAHLAGEDEARSVERFGHGDPDGIAALLRQLPRARERTPETGARLDRLADLAAKERVPEVRLSDQPDVAGRLG